MVNQMIADDDDVQNMSNIIDFEDNQAAENYKAMLYWTHFDVKHFRDFKNHTNNILTCSFPQLVEQMSFTIVHF